MLSSPAIFLFLLAADPPSQVGAPGDPLHPWEWVSLVPGILAGLQSCLALSIASPFPSCTSGPLVCSLHHCPGSVMPKMMPTQLRVLHGPRHSRTCLQEEEAAPSAGLGACPPCGNGCRKRRGQPGVGGWARWLVTSSSSNAAASNPRSLKTLQPPPFRKKALCNWCTMFSVQRYLLNFDAPSSDKRTKHTFPEDQV